jgi:hypothetical protein
MQKLIDSLQATIKLRLKKDVVFEKVNENEFTTQSTEPDKIAFFAMQAKFKVRKNNNTLTLTVPRGTL